MQSSWLYGHWHKKLVRWGGQDLRWKVLVLLSFILKVYLFNYTIYTKFKIKLLLKWYVEFVESRVIFDNKIDKAINNLFPDLAYIERVH